MNSSEEEQAEFLKTGVLHVEDVVLHIEENGNQVAGDAENNNNGLDDTWECVAGTASAADKRSSRWFLTSLRKTRPCNMQRFLSCKN